MCSVVRSVVLRLAQDATRVGFPKGRENESDERLRGAPELLTTRCFPCVPNLSRQANACFD